MPKAQHKVIIIGLVGLPGAGKTTVARFLGQKGYLRITLSAFIKQEAKKEGITEFSREVLQDYGNKMRMKFGPQILAQLAHKKIREQSHNKIVIDGIRNLYEAAYLKVENHFTLIGIVANPKIRYERIMLRGGKKFYSDYKTFLKQEHREESLGSKEIGLRVKECLKRVSYRIKNEGSIEHLHQQTDQVLDFLPSK